MIVVRERDGESVPAVLRIEGQARLWRKARVLKGTVLNADEATSRDGLHAPLRAGKLMARGPSARVEW